MTLSDVDRSALQALGDRVRQAVHMERTLQGQGFKLSEAVQRLHAFRPLGRRGLDRCAVCRVSISTEAEGFTCGELRCRTELAELLLMEIGGDGDMSFPEAVSLLNGFLQVREEFLEACARLGEAVRLVFPDEGDAGRILVLLEAVLKSMNRMPEPKTNRSPLPLFPGN